MVTSTAAPTANTSSSGGLEETAKYSGQEACIEEHSSGSSINTLCASDPHHRVGAGRISVTLKPQIAADGDPDACMPSSPTPWESSVRKSSAACLVHFSDLAGRETAQVHSSSRCRSTAKSRSSVTIRLPSDGILRRTGFSFKTVDFATRPKTRPIKLRGGFFNPTAISIHMEQCASIWAALNSAPLPPAVVLEIRHPFFYLVYCRCFKEIFHGYRSPLSSYRTRLSSTDLYCKLRPYVPSCRRTRFSFAYQGE